MYVCMYVSSLDTSIYPFIHPLLPPLSISISISISLSPSPSLYPSISLTDVAYHRKISKPSSTFARMLFCMGCSDAALAWASPAVEVVCFRASIEERELVSQGVIPHVPQICGFAFNMGCL